MICPQCKTENRDDRSECYHCNQELSTLRMIVNRARNHYNEALEHAERDRSEEAIRELKHALELDGSFVEAWLVLGTLYAREERFDEAKEAWETAMAQDPRFARGHEYLLKAQHLEPSLPQLRKLKQTALILGGLLLLAVAFGLYQSRPDTGMQKIDQALTLHADQKWAAALERLADAKSDPLASRKAKRAAGVLGDELSDHLNSMLDSVRLLAENKRFSQTVADIRKIESLDPPGWVQQELGAIKTTMTTAMVSAAEKELVAFREGRQTFSDLDAKLKGWIEVAGDSEGKERLIAILDEGSSEFRRTLLAGLRPEILAIDDDAKAAQRIDELAVQYPSLRKDLEDILRSRLAVVAEARSNEFDRLVREGKLDDARERLVEFKSFYEGLGRTAPEDITRKMEAQVQQTERAIALQNLKSAFQAGEYERVLRLAPELASLDLTGPQEAEVKAQREDAERLLAVELWDWSQERDQDFETLNLSLEDARRMIEFYPLIIRHAPPAEATFRTTHSLFRAATAHLRLGQAEQAKGLLDRLRTDYPESAVLGYPAFRRVQERLAAELARA